MVAIPTPTSAVMGNWGKAYTTEQVSRITPPRETETHKPQHHHNIFDMVSNGLQRSGFQHSEPLHYVANNPKTEGPARFMTVMNVVHDKISDRMGGLEAHRQVFIQNSYDKSLPISIMTGLNICICSNGLTFGQVEGRVKRKQTRRVAENLYGLIYGGIDRILGGLIEQDNKVVTYQNAEMTNLMADHIIMECMRQGVVNPAGVKEVYDNWATPNYDEYKDRNAWSLINSFTERDRGRNIFRRHGTHRKLVNIVDNYIDNAHTDRMLEYDSVGTQPDKTTDISTTTADF